MDAFIYSSKLVSYIIQYYYKFGIFVNPNFREFLWPIYYLTRRTISQLMISGHRVSAFLPFYQMPIITPIQNPTIRGRILQHQSQKILRNSTQEGNTGISDIENDLADHANIGIQEKGGQVLGFSPESRPSTLSIEENYSRINSTAQLRRRLGITSLDSVYQGLKQVYEPASTRVTKAWLEHIKSLHLVGGNPLGNTRHQLSQEVTIPRESVPFSNFGLIESSKHSLDSVGTVVSNVTNGVKGARADAAATYFTDLDVSISSIAEIPDVVPGAIPGAISFPELDSYTIIGDAIRGVKAARADAAAAAYAVPASTSHAASVKTSRLLSSRAISIPELVSEKAEMGKTIGNTYDNLLHIFSIWTHVSQLLSYLPVVDQFFKMAYGVTDDYLGSGLYKANIISKSLPVVADAYSRYRKATGFPAYAEAMETLIKHRKLNFTSGYQRIDEEYAGLGKGYPSEELDNWMKFGRDFVIPFDGIKYKITGGKQNFLRGSDDKLEELYDLESKDALDVLSKIEGFSDITQMDKTWARGEKILSQEVEGMKVRLWEDVVKNQPLSGLSPRAKEIQEKLSLNLDQQKLVREMIPLGQIKQIHNKYSESISDLAGLVDSQPSLFKGKIPSVLADKNQLSGIARKFESVITSLRKSANSSSEKMVSGLENHIRETEDMTQWKRAVGAGLSKELLSVLPQPITALAVGSTEREGNLNTLSLNLIPPRGTLGNFNFSGTRNLPYKSHQTIISSPVTQPSVSSLPEQEKGDKPNSTSTSTYGSTFDWDDDTDNTAHAFELFPDDLKGTPPGDAGNSRISPQASGSVTPNRSVLQRYIKDSIQGEILKYYHNDLSYSPQPHIEERERKLYLEVQLELERNLKDELRRYGYVN